MEVPISAIAWLCRRLSEYGITFSEGDVVLPGSCLEAIEMQPGTDLEGVFEGWGGVRVRYGS
jgi:2-keto-4-pentenoate hydratase